MVMQPQEELPDDQKRIQSLKAAMEHVTVSPLRLKHTKMANILPYNCLIASNERRVKSQ